MKCNAMGKVDVKAKSLDQYEIFKRGHWELKQFKNCFEKKND